MMQHRTRQQRQTSTVLRSNLCGQLSKIDNVGPLSQQHLCRSTAALFPTTITTLVSSFTITSLSPSAASSTSSSSINRKNNRRISSNITNTRSTISAFSCSSVLLSVLAWSVTLLLISSCFGIADAGIIMGHSLGKRSFTDVRCKGVYDRSIFARLDRICEDCYNLFREPQLHGLCRKNCFTSDYFKGCVDVLLMQSDVPKIQTWIKQLHGADPGI